MTSITLKVEREKSMLRRHPWIFEGAIEKTEGVIRSGDTVDILATPDISVCRLMCALMCPFTK